MSKREADQNLVPEQENEVEERLKDQSEGLGRVHRGVGGVEGGVGGGQQWRVAGVPPDLRMNRQAAMTSRHRSVRFITNYVSLAAVRDLMY